MHISSPLEMCVIKAKKIRRVVYMDGVDRKGEEKREGKLVGI